MKCTRCGNEYELGFNGSPFKHMGHCANCKFQLDQLAFSKATANPQTSVAGTSGQTNSNWGFILIIGIIGLCIEYWPIVLGIGAFILVLILVIATYSYLTQK